MAPTIISTTGTKNVYTSNERMGVTGCTHCHASSRIFRRQTIVSDHLFDKLTSGSTRQGPRRERRYITHLGTVNRDSASPIPSLKVPSLDHKARDDTVEVGVLVAEVFGEGSVFVVLFSVFVQEWVQME